MRSVLLLLLPIALAACARDDIAYPSLAVRPAEKRGFAEPEAPPPEPVRADPVLDGKIAEANRTLARIVAGFDKGAGAAEAAASRAGARTVGSDAWLDAQTALAALDDWRAQASALTTDLEQLSAGRAAELAPAYPALEAVRAAATAEVAREDAGIARIAARLPAA